MYWEQIAFCFFAGGFLMMSIIKTFYKFKSQEKNQSCEKSQTRMRNFLIIKCEDYKVKLFKAFLNYNASFNNSIIIVGTLSESYFFGVRLIGNMMAAAIGYIIAFYLVIPFLISLEEDIKTPYQYFERRYGNRKYVRAVTASVGVFFYFSFLTLYLYGCSNLLSQIIPEIPLLYSSVLIGVYSLVGSCIGGFTQTTKTNVFQFLVVLGGLLSASFITYSKFTRHSNFNQLFQFLQQSNRTQFFNTNVDLDTKYTILNQLVSVIIPWTCFHSLLLPNFLRYRSTKGSDLRKRLMAIGSMPSMLIVNTICILAGGIWCFLYFYGCDPLSAQRISNPNQTGTFWLYLIFTDRFPAFTGILFASMVSYSIVQHSMGMALCGHTIYTEIFDQFLLDKCAPSEKAKRRLKLFMVIVVGCSSTVYAVLLQFVRATILNLLFLFNNAINSPLFGLYLLSTLNPLANHFGAILAFLINLTINFWLGLASLNIFTNIKSQAYPQTTLICNDHLKVYSNLTLAAIKLSNQSNTQTDLNDYYPKNEILYFLYSISSIWYCLFSVLFNLLFGSLFSLIYSYIKTGTSDLDNQLKEKRKNYLYFTRKRNG